MPDISQNGIVVLVYHIINLYFAYFIAKLVVIRILKSEIDQETKNEKPKKRGIFDQDIEPEIIREQDVAMKQPLLILSALLPFFILSTVYFVVFDIIYDFLVTVVTVTNRSPISVLFSAFLSGFAAAKIIFSLSAKDNELYSNRDLILIKNRLGAIEIFYLSSSFCLIVFSYINFSSEANIIKGIITFFMIGNAVYLIFRPNIKHFLRVRSYLNKKKEKSNDVIF